MPEWLAWALVAVTGSGMCLLLVLVLLLTRVLHQATHRLVRTVEVLTRLVAEIRSPGSVQSAEVDDRATGLDEILKTYEESDYV